VKKICAGIRIGDVEKSMGVAPPCFVAGLGSAYQRPVFTAHRSLLTGYRGVILGPYVPQAVKTKEGVQLADG
jgi:hypothetical protein